jgi:predicted MFS family arabinose efflux permease
MLEALRVRDFRLLWSGRLVSLLGTWLPAAVVIGLFGSMVLVTQSTTLQRTVPNEELGRATALFVTAEALATLIGAVSGPALAGWGGITLVALASCLLTAATAVLALRTLP